MVTLVKAEIALLTPLFAPWFILLSLTVARTGLFYHQNKRLVDKAIDQVPNIIWLLNCFRSTHPLLFRKMMLTAGKTILTNLPSGVTAEDVAFFIGRVIKKGSGLPSVTLGTILRVVLVVAGIVALTHLPHVAAEGLAASRKREY